ncbi:MAG TPA: type II secretion system F family protein [Bellilinea sp.]|nr:type II secretion system F family protein [Bellilinea sp.]
MPILLIIILLILAGAITLTVIGLRNPESENDRALQARLEEFSQTGQMPDLRELELSQPFTDRIIYPVARKLGEIAMRFTPQNAMNSISRKLELAGTSARVDPTMILALQLFLGAVFAAIVVLVSSLGAANWPPSRTFLLGLVFGFLGFYFPQLWLTSKINKRQKEVRKAMPDALDLLTICVEAGLGFEAAMARVSEKWASELSIAFARAIQEIQLGKTRREALRDMADRIGLPEMTSFVAAVIQSEQLGVSLAKVLRIQSDQMRVKRRQLAEEAAHKAPLKMLIPMTLLIFPSLIIVLMTPAALKLFQSALGGMFGL